MYCNWLLDSNQQCPNIVNCDRLVCDSCKTIKDKLYTNYKRKEKKVISAISASSVRGNNNEMMKVISRLKDVIEARSLFTSMLSEQVRDSGHEYHIDKLFHLLVEYSNKLQFTKVEHEYDEEENIPNDSVTTFTSPVIEECVQVVTESIRTLEEDPFSSYTEEIQNYKKAMLFVKASKEKLITYTKDNYYHDKSFTNIMTSLYWIIYLQVTMSYKRISHLIRGGSFINNVRYEENKKIQSPLLSVIALSSIFNDFSDNELKSWLVSITEVFIANRMVKLTTKISKTNEGSKMILLCECPKLQIKFKECAVIYWLGADNYRWTICDVVDMNIYDLDTNTHRIIRNKPLC